MKIYFTSNSTLQNFDNFLSKLDFSDESKLEIFTDHRWINTNPAGLVLAAALASTVGKQNATIDGNLATSGAYLDAMGLYNFVSTDSPFHINKKEPSGRYIPITNIKTEADQTKFLSDIIPLLHLGREESLAIRYALYELVRNVLEHSMSKDGAFVAAQYNKRKNKISIGICDTGIGIKASLNRYHNPANDLSALRLALMPGVSGTTSRPDGTEQNAGAGLFIVKSLARITRSYFVIYSGDSLYKLLKYDKRVQHPRINADPFDDRYSYKDNLPNFNGTLVGVDISLSEGENFADLLETIKRTYSIAIRERKQRQYKRFKFL